MTIKRSFVLPTEILCLVFSYLRRSSRSFVWAGANWDLYSCSLVCRAWKNCANEVLYGNMYLFLRPSVHSKLMKSLNDNPGLCELVRGLTVCKVDEDAWHHGWQYTEAGLAGEARFEATAGKRPSYLSQERIDMEHRTNWRSYCKAERYLLGDADWDVWDVEESSWDSDGVEHRLEADLLPLGCRTTRNFWRLVKRFPNLVWLRTQGGLLYCDNHREVNEEFEQPDTFTPLPAGPFISRAQIFNQIRRLSITEYSGSILEHLSTGWPTLQALKVTMEFSELTFPLSLPTQIQYLDLPLNESSVEQLSELLPQLPFLDALTLRVYCPVPLTLEGLGSLIRSLPRLRKLRLRHDESEAFDIICNLAASFQGLRGLEHLSLNSWPDLDTLRLFPPSLRTITFDHIWFCNRWRDLGDLLEWKQKGGNSSNFQRLAIWGPDEGQRRAELVAGFGDAGVSVYISRHFRSSSTCPLGIYVWGI
ncbi:hypothetical protein T439DRAFT_330226 [Meredithblackwellia eburnea MCA 4105]